MQKNKKVAKILLSIAQVLDAENVAFKPYAYRRAAFSINALEKSLDDVYIKGGRSALEQIEGVGKNIAEKIEEYLLTGEIEYYEEYLKKKMPLSALEILKIEGLGPKRTKALHDHLGIETMDDLYRAAKENRIASLPGFGEKTEKNILEGITFLKKDKGRFLLGETLPLVEEILEELKKTKYVQQISSAGSVRRMKETIGDIDILITTGSPEKVMDVFVDLPGVDKVLMRGPTKSSVRMEDGLTIDLRVVKKESYGSALQYFTGSKEHNIATRKIAVKKGLKLSEYGLFKGEEKIAGEDEKGIYKALGLTFIDPELRENRGEIEASTRQVRGKSEGLPNIVQQKDIKGDLHCHSDWNGGVDTIEEIIKKATDKGYQYIGISDHTKFLRIENGLDEKQLKEQRKEILELNSENSKIHILQGCETNILEDGSVDIRDDVLKELDYVIAGVHSGFKTNKRKMTERIIRTIKNPNINIISHPTGRLLKKREAYQIDFGKILRAAKEYKVALEINASPARMDLNDRNIRQAKEIGVRMVISSDSHQKKQMDLLSLGVAQARRGWAEKKDIINTYTFEKLLNYFDK